MATLVRSMAVSGVDGFLVEIEASNIRGQQQMISIIGLPDQAVKSHWCRGRLQEYYDCQTAAVPIVAGILWNM